MKVLMLMTALILTVSCGKKTTYDLRSPSNPTTNSGSDNSNSTYSITLEASKSYNPVQYQDGVYNLSSAKFTKIPSYITVIAGNAGNWTAEIHFDSLICIYKGGSSMTNPLYTNNTTEINNGKKYLFSYCKNSTSSNTGNVVGDLVEVSTNITLAIKNGDRQALTTGQVSLDLE